VSTRSTNSAHAYESIHTDKTYTGNIVDWEILLLKFFAGTLRQQKKLKKEAFLINIKR
jgi:hypothetical protein